MNDRANQPRINSNAANQPAASRTNLVRHPVPRRRIVPLTQETRVSHIQAATYHNYTEHWVKVQSLYNCDCGRHIGFQFQEPVIGQANLRVDEDVISVKSSPAKVDVLNISLSSSDGSAIVIDDKSDSSSLLEERVGYVPPESESEEVSSTSEPACSATDTELRESQDEPMC